MKHSTATVLVLSQGIVVAPSLLSKLSHQNTKSVRHAIAVSMKTEQHHVAHYDACWLLCAREEI
ncbi:unnamed protein product [Fusarium venenatum]|uniref:Uncharacterized protein n=1 Tax=Fusarium venenatum TaxID=56646 RepID=A0A2L2T3I0_9HYPO|nr:uncharacterized protein FVRRES_06609 [Fusarium venenatum]CEI62173.1 unnamed protein product [Fusarium venenatum]